MVKEVNIHVKTTGTEQAKQGIKDVATEYDSQLTSLRLLQFQATATGKATEDMGVKAAHAGGWMKETFSAIGSAFSLAAIAALAGKFGQFFDNIKTRADEAVRKTQELRVAYKDLFEALDAFDEKSRKIITKETGLLLQQTATPETLGLPIINAYTRQFHNLVEAGELTQEQYDQGLKEMLGWGVRHGQGATPELITMMAGWGMKKPEQQGEFRRMISAASQKAGLTEEEIIDALSRGMPTIKAMGWTPQQSLETIATLAAGEVGRKKTAMPAAVLQALMTPQLTDIKKMGIPEKVTEDPQQLLAYLGTRREQMSQKEFLGMLIKIYGGEAAPGVFKLLGAPKSDIGEVLRQAAGPEGIKAEQREEINRKKTLEGLEAETKAKVKQIEQDLTSDEEYMEKIREIGAAEREIRRRRHPILQKIRETYVPGIPYLEKLLPGIPVPEETQKEEAAYRKWYENLTPEEKREVPWWMSYPEYFVAMTPQQKYRALMLIGTAPKTGKLNIPKEKPKEAPVREVEVPEEKPKEALVEKVEVPEETPEEMPVREEAPAINLKALEEIPKETAVEGPIVVPAAAETPVELPVRPSEIAVGHEVAPRSVSYEIHYHNETIYTPRVGSDERGPRAPASLK